MDYMKLKSIAKGAKKIELKDLVKEAKKFDEFGNNIDFSDSVLGPISVKGLFGKWVGYILSLVRDALIRYYLRTGNRDVGDVGLVKSFFNDTQDKIDKWTPILEDMVARNISGIEDIFIAIYGVGSDEVYVLREFQSRYREMEEWDENSMWNDCCGKQRLKDILF